MIVNASMPAGAHLYSSSSFCYRHMPEKWRQRDEFMRTENSQTPPKAHFSVHVMLIAMSFVWGINFPIIKGALAELSPLSFNAIRFSTSSLLLLVLLYFREKNFSIRRGDISRFILLALVGNTVYQLFFIHGIARTTASNSSLILATTPIFIVLLGSILGVEKITKSILQSIIISFTGIILVITGSGKPLVLTDQSLIGDLLTIANPICWATYTVLSKPMLKEYTPLKLTSLTMAIGTIPLVLISIPSLNAQNWSIVSTQAWLGLAFSAFFAIGIGYLMWYTGVSLIGSARTALYENLVTVFAVASAWILLSENMSPVQITGASLVFVSLYLVQRTKQS